MVMWTLAALSARAIANATNITVYHVSPLQYGALPINMDSGDATGDMFYDLFEVIVYPLACPNGTATKSPPEFHGCENPEAEVSEHLMVNKLTLEVDALYSDYAKCNIGRENNTDGHGHPCPHNMYCCFCDNPTDPHGPSIPCQDTVGRMSVYERFNSSICQANSTAAECYRAHAFEKLTPSNPGYWYSSLNKSYCGSMGRDAEHAECTWRVLSVDKIVTSACHVHVFGDVVQANGDPACLEGCGAQRYNQSSACWTDCFYKAALGADAGKPGGGGPGKGMSLDDLVAAWEKPFGPIEEGGCPAQEGVQPSSWKPFSGARRSGDPRSE